MLTLCGMALLLRVMLCAHVAWLCLATVAAAVLVSGICSNGGRKGCITLQVTTS
jgi:hypothetical protein